MCSVNDYECGIDNNPPIVSSTVKLENSKCKKCDKTEIDIVLRGNDAYCKSCFLASATHKFRATLGKSKLVRPSDKVLVAHSGKAGSTALLHLIRAGMQEFVHKRLVFKTIVLYIDEGGLEDRSLDEREAILQDISNQIEDLGFTGFVTTINESLSEFDPLIWSMDSCKFKEEETVKMTFDALSDQTAKEDLLGKLRHRLLIRAARKLQCNKILTGESATDLSISILSNISLGRGAHLSLDVGFADTRFSDVMILRPMRNFTNKEITYYLRLQNFKVPRLSGTSGREKSDVSIQKLTEKFVNDLDSEFHGTVTTVFRTAEKLGSIKSGEELERTCVLCNASLDTATSGEVSAIQATAYSQLVSTSKIFELDVENIESKPSVSCNDDCKCNQNCREEGEKNDMEVLKKCLCYGCKLILSRFKDEKFIPSFIRNAARSAVSFEKMHEEIADFLL